MKLTKWYDSRTHVPSRVGEYEFEIKVPSILGEFTATGKFWWDGFEFSDLYWHRLKMEPPFMWRGLAVKP